MKLAIFDFDGTLLMKDTLPCLTNEWIRQKRSKVRCAITLFSVAPFLLLYKTGLLSREKMKCKVFKRFNQIYLKMTRKEIEEFFDQAYPQLSTMFNQLVLAEIQLAKQQGFHCVLLSGAYIELLKIVSSSLGINTVIGAQLAYKDDKFDDKGETPYIDGRTKRSLLLEEFSGQEVDWEASRAFGDSFTDVWVLDLVGEQVAVNPDADLLAYAQKNRWRIIKA